MTPLHWTLGTIDFENCVITHYDPLQAQPGGPIEKYTFARLQHIANVTYTHDRAPPKSSWKQRIQTGYRQENSYDCGTCVIVMGFHALLQMRVPEILDCKLWRVVFIALLEGKTRSADELQLPASPKPVVEVPDSDDWISWSERVFS